MENILKLFNIGDEEFTKIVLDSKSIYQIKKKYLVKKSVLFPTKL